MKLGGRERSRGDRIRTGGVYVRTEIVLDGDPGEKASHCAGINTKKEPVDPAFRGPVVDLRELRDTGGIRPNYDYKKLRNEV